MATTTTTTEFEINLRLDEDGRTALPDETDSFSSSFRTAMPIYYDSRTTVTRLVRAKNRPVQEQAKRDCDGGGSGNDTGIGNKVVTPDVDCLFDELLLDCEIADCGLMPRTFWMPAEAVPRFSLEQLALDIFHYHVKRWYDDIPPPPDVVRYDPQLSGAEWWVQLRPSPELTGRYAMHVHTDNDKPKDKADMSRTGISFHWDKDEELRILCGGNTYVHSHLSTVTYLTDYGAPTLALNCRVDPLTGEWILPTSSEDSYDKNQTYEAFLSWPHRGKHLSFDGRFLHAAPPDLMEDGMFERQCSFVASSSEPESARLLQRRHRRVTFLVNIWLNYHPLDVHRFPDTMVDKMSGRNSDEMVRIRFHDRDNATPTHSMEIRDGTVVRITGRDSQGISTTSTKDLKLFTWPLGDCGSSEVIRLNIPVKEIQDGCATGADYHITYHTSTGGHVDVHLQKGSPSNDDRHDNKRPKLQDPNKKNTEKDCE